MVDCLCTIGQPWKSFSALRAGADEDAVGADAPGQRLRNEDGKLAATVICPSTDTAVVARDQAATRAAMVLSDLLARADERAGELAKAYDRARIAGQHCEHEYDALVPYCAKNLRRSA